MQGEGAVAGPQLAGDVGGAAVRPGQQRSDGVAAGVEGEQAVHGGAERQRRDPPGVDLRDGVAHRVADGLPERLRILDGGAGLGLVEVVGGLAVPVIGAVGREGDGLGGGGADVDAEDQVGLRHQTSSVPSSVPRPRTGEPIISAGKACSRGREEISTVTCFPAGASA